MDLRDVQEADLTEHDDCLAEGTEGAGVSRTGPSLQLGDDLEGGVTPEMGLGGAASMGLTLRLLAPQDLGSEFPGAPGPGGQPGVLALSWHGGERPSWPRPLSVWRAVAGRGRLWNSNKKNNCSFLN